LVNVITPSTFCLCANTRK